MEIARYKENTPNTLNETSSSQYVIPMADGNEYQIVKEKLGYIIKKTISESSTDYIEPMKNRKYFPSYSQALKRLNLLAKELNRLNENEEGIELFGEQKKFVLKTPKPAPAPEAEAPMPPAEPPAVPAPALPPSPETTADMGPEEMSPEVDASAEMDAEVTTPDGEMDIEAGSEEMGMDQGEEVVTFKQIQKLTGKLTQKIRDFDNQDGMTSEDIKYVINMVLSALDLKNLSDEDKEDIMAKFEEAEERPEGEMDLGAEEDMTSDTAPVDQIGMQVDAISVSASTNTKNVTAQQYYEQMVLPSQAGSMCESPTLKTDLPPSLQGLDVVIVEGLCGVLNEGPRAIIAHNGYMYMLSSGFTGEVDAQLVYKVLSSFAFLD